MSFTQKCVFFQYLPRTAEAYFLPNSWISGGFHAGKRVKIGRRGMCSASGRVLQMPLWPLTRRSERSLSARREGQSCKRRISAWKPVEGPHGNCPKFGRLYASAVKRSRPKWGR